MNIEVTKDFVKITRKDIIHEGEYKINECVFSFSNVYDGLTKKAIFETSGKVIEMAITNDKCDIPSEILLSNDDECNLRVYAYELDNDDYVLRYSPAYDTFTIDKGSYIPNAQGNQEITPSEFEQYSQALNEGLEQVANVDIDAEQTSTGATITITNRDGEQKSVEIYNGGSGGNGVPSGGLTNQVLAKKSDADYDMEWKTIESGETGAKFWQGNYDNYEENKEYIDNNYDIVITQEEVN